MVRDELIRQLEIACEALYNAADLTDDRGRWLEFELVAYKLGEIIFEIKNKIKNEQIRRGKNTRGNSKAV